MVFIDAKNEVGTCAYTVIFVPTNIYANVHKHIEIITIIIHHLLYLENCVMWPPLPKYYFRTFFTFL